MSSHALILDFDGTVLDTETPACQSTAQIWADYGVELPMDWWLAGMGTDRKQSWVQELENRVGQVLDQDLIMETRQRIKNEMTENQPVLPGVTELLDAAACRGIATAIGSSSPHAWVDQHLKRVGLYEKFSYIVCRDDVGEVAKPAPDVFLHALKLLGVEATAAAVVEDSPNGLKAALAAGIRTVVVPNPLVTSLDFSGAYARLETLDEMPPDALLDVLFGQI
ncbi:MAG: HAD-IA family hydrolase [Actinomycetota bacterium]|jgi:HAD superfamily hydrolase (TIGR01509 family)|nr:HAD-IA family hydrolase [Actinomycetota bacterium]